MPTWAVAVSIVATSLSAVTFIGVPQSSYSGNLTYLATNLGMIIAAIVIAYLFVPAFYKSQSSSIYDLLERRFDARARKAASVTFLLGRILASGVRVFIGAMPASIILFGTEHGLATSNLGFTIAALAFVGTVYTLTGGISSVIWSDVIQYIILIGAAITAVVLIAGTFTAPMPEIINALQSGALDGTSKLTVIDPSLDLTHSFSLPACIIGFTLLGIGSYGTDQDLAQRMLTCKTAKHSARSILSGILLGIPTVSVFLVLGLLLWIVYQRPELTSTHAVRSGDTAKVFLDYIMTQIPPGVRGLMMAGLFAAGLSSMNSAINAMGAAFISDLYQPIRADKSDRHYVRIGRLAVVASGVALGVCAIGCMFWWQRADGETLVNFALGTMAFAYAGLVAVFLTALLSKRGNSTTVIAALLFGFIWMVLSQQLLHDSILGKTPTDQQGWLDSYYAIHFTWKLTLGVIISAGICMLGSPKGQAS